MNEIGYQSLQGMMSIPGVKFHHINLDEDQPYMGERYQTTNETNTTRWWCLLLMMNLVLTNNTLMNC